MKYVCSICGYVYDEAKEGKPFAELPDSWVCPICGAAKSAFRSEQAAEAPRTPAAPIHIDEDMKKLSAGELSALSLIHIFTTIITSAISNRWRKKLKRWRRNMTVPLWITKCPMAECRRAIRSS